jgi:hypothetical protein
MMSRKPDALPKTPAPQAIGRRGCPYCRGVSRADRIGADRKVSQQHERT